MSVSIEVVFAFFGEEFDGTDVSLSGFECVEEGVVVFLCMEYGGFSSDFRGRVCVGVGYEGIGVKL